MKTFSVVVAIITALLLLSTLICGLWIKSKNLVNDVESLKFHMNIGIASVVFGLITIGLLISSEMKR